MLCDLRYQKLQHVFECCLSPQAFCRSFIALSMIRSLMSERKSAVQVCQVAVVVMETTQLVLSHFENFYCSYCRIE